MGRNKIFLKQYSILFVIDLVSTDKYNSSSRKYKKNSEKYQKIAKWPPFSSIFYEIPVIPGCHQPSPAPFKFIPFLEKVIFQRKFMVFLKIFFAQKKEQKKLLRVVPMKFI